MAHGNLVQSLARGLDILELMSGAESGVRVKDVAAALGVRPPTAHNLLRTLVAHGFAAHRGPVYVLGPAVAELSARREQRQLYLLAAGEVRSLAAAMKTAMVTFAEPVGSELYLRLRIGPDHPGLLQKPLAHAISWYASASGLVIQAFLDEERRHAIYSHHPFDEYGAALWQTPARLERQLAEIRRKQYLVYPFPVRSAPSVPMAVPVFSPAGGIVGALGVRVPLNGGGGMSAAEQAQVIGLMRRHAARLKAALEPAAHEGTGPGRVDS